MATLPLLLSIAHVDKVELLRELVARGRKEGQPRVPVSEAAARKLIAAGTLYEVDGVRIHADLSKGHVNPEIYDTFHGGPGAFADAIAASERASATLASWQTRAALPPPVPREVPLRTGLLLPPPPTPLLNHIPNVQWSRLAESASAGTWTRPFKDADGFQRLIQSPAMRTAEFTLHQTPNGPYVRCLVDTDSTLWIREPFAEFKVWCNEAEMLLSPQWSTIRMLFHVKHTPERIWLARRSMQ